MEWQKYGILPAMNAMADSQLVTMSSPADRKVALFRALFRGREDVYARRFESAKSGKKGYSPVCEVEWTRGLCDKRRVACALCPNRRFRPLSDAAVEAHLRGHDAAGRPFVLGVYPLLADDSVRFAAIDFDKASWRSDSASVCETLRALGWPVALPVELRDDKTYAETIKRLARDGADGETADLFAAAALAQRGQAPESGGRSAAEKFLFRYLEAMPATQGLFALNGRLPVPFGPNAFMEVDLLCASRRVAVEVDGKFHFASPENYRRDRRKDFLLQKAGYLVLRFLADDVVERLPEVMDAINVALDSHAQSQAATAACDWAWIDV